MQVPFNDLKPGTRALRAELEAAIGAVLDSGRYILGQQGEAFEREFAAWLGVEYAVGVGSGTDAIRLALQALGVGPGHEVITPANAGVPPVAAIVATGARPVFVDVDPATHALDPRRVPAALSPRTRAILAVHLYGHPANVQALRDLADARGIALVEDCAQAHGAQAIGRTVGTFGTAAAFSFYPTKNLGALGDAGLVATNDAALAERLRLLRNYGWRTAYVSEVFAWNARLDELQAAILRAKLPHLAAWNALRRERAAWYAELLSDTPLCLPVEQPWAEHVYHLYVVCHSRRDALRAALAERGIGTAIHYPEPVHLQAPYRQYGGGAGSLPVTERLAAEVLSLPLFPELERPQVERVVAALKDALGALA